MCHNDCPVIPVSGGAPITETSIDLATQGEGAASLPIFTVEPEGDTAVPGILLISDIYGPGPFYQDMARRLALLGYRVALPDFFSRLESLPADADRQTVMGRNRNLDQPTALIDVQGTLDWLRTQEGATGLATGKIGVIGFCMGGTYVMLAGARSPRPDAGVAFYGFPKRERTPTSPIMPADEDEVAGMDMPLLALWGDQDAGVGMENVADYDAALTRYTKPHEFFIYPDIGHAFMTFDESAPAWPYAKDAWERTVAHFRTHLQGGGSGA
ncbi:MAG: dienelactone hydrolase family protein [Thermomicrobiales bacterium]